MNTQPGRWVCDDTKQSIWSVDAGEATTIFFFSLSFSGARFQTRLCLFDKFTLDSIVDDRVGNFTWISRDRLGRGSSLLGSSWAFFSSGTVDEV